MYSRRPAPGARRGRALRGLALAALLALGLVQGCAPGVTPFVVQAPLWRDPDRRPFAGELEPAFTPKQWDAIEKSLITPVTDALAVRAKTEAINVNALDEVPDSSWFENRVGLRPFSPSDAARGPCAGAAIDTAGPWTLKSAKPDGADPGFVVTTPDGRRYLIKLDDRLQGARISTADVVASRIYHAAGFNVPCNTLVTFKREILRVAAGARSENSLGEKIPFTPAHLDSILSAVQQRADGSYRGMASLYLPGRPLGPWEYEGVRADDRNDVVPHEHRRELRGSRSLAAWTDHSDQHAQNTLAMWIDTRGGLGFVRHNLLDFGDCFGSLWGHSAQQAWRREHVYWFDPRQLLGDFATFGALQRPWDRAELGPTGLVFGYYTDAAFDPESWRPSYPNPAFERMTERDAAWMARIIARMTESHISAMVAEARLETHLQAELVRVLLGRRRAILERYLTRLSPLSDAAITGRSGEPWLCLRDLAVEAGVSTPGRRYSARATQAFAPGATETPPVTADVPGRPCIPIAKLRDRTPNSGYWVVDVEIRDDRAAGSAPRRSPGPLSLHLFARGHDVQLIGVERRE